MEKLLPKRAPILEEEFTFQNGRLRDKLGAQRADLNPETQKEWMGWRDIRSLSSQPSSARMGAR